MAGLSRVLAASVDILDAADQRVRSESPFWAGAVGPGHGVSHPQQWLLSSLEVAIRQVRRCCALPNSLRYQATLSVVLARLPALDHQSLALEGEQVR